MHIAHPLLGAIIGFSVAAPVGPVGILCIRRALTQGFASGFVSGLGAATVHGTYGAVAVFGVTAVADVLMTRQTWLLLADVAVLGYLGFRIFRTAPCEQASPVQEGSVAVYLSTLSLTLVNPVTLLSFASLLTGLAIAGSGEAQDAGAVVLGIFVGSTVWWAVLSCLSATIRSRIRMSQMRWINRVSGAVMWLFGLAAIVNVIR